MIKSKTNAWSAINLKWINMVIQFLLFVSSKPHCQAEFKSIESGLLTITCMPNIKYTPWVGKMNQRLRCDWLPELARWRNLDLVLFCVFMDLDSVSVHKHAKKELSQYPAILTSHLVNIHAMQPNNPTVLPSGQRSCTVAHKCTPNLNHSHRIQITHTEFKSLTPNSNYSHRIQITHTEFKSLTLNLK